ncbi:MAG: hypothetical protein GVY24_06790 [Planctomycetes bacterium]|jgi:hypothetical protein|nr:hypothetical protein [Planctomycetota bacterium]
MVLIMVALVFAAVLAATFLAGQSTTSGISQNVNRHARARLIAESGLTTAMEYVRTQDDWRTAQAEGYWLPEQALGGGTFQVLFEEEDGDLTDDGNDTVTLRVIGRYQGVSHEVSALLMPTVPPAAKDLLLVVANTAGLSEDDKLRVVQAQTWDYNVTLINADASRSELDAAIAVNDVVWVSPTAPAGDLSEKLLHSVIGVVAEHRDQWTSLKLAEASSARSTRGLEGRITSASHYITSPLGSGPVSLTTADADLVRMTPTLAAGAQLLATDSAESGAALVALDAGGTLVDDSAAVGRRVGMPWGVSADFAFDQLTGESLTLLQRALEWAAAPPEGPPALAHWMLDETDGTIAHDARGDHDGQVIGGSAWALGQVVGGLEMDGYDDYINVFNHEDFQVTEALTITAWVRPDSFNAGSDVNIILRKGEGNPNNWQFSIKDGRPTLFLDTYDDYGIKCNTTLFAGQWYHLAATWDGQTARLYVNGQPDNGNGESHHGPIGTDDRPIYIGGRSGAAGYDRFDGRIDDVRFYNRAISAAEVKVMYEEGIAESDEPRLVALYRFEEVKPTPALAGHWALDESAQGGGGIACRNLFRVYDTARINSYESARGPYSDATATRDAQAATTSTSRDDFEMDTSSSLYGHAFCGAGGDPDSVIDAHIGSITGQRAAMTRNITINAASAPSGMPGNEGDRSYNGAVTIDKDRTYEDLTLNNGAVLTVSGHQRIWCTRHFTASGNAQIVIPDGSSLTLYVGRSVTVEDDAVLNADTSDPSRLSIIGYNDDDNVTLRNRAEVAGIIHSDRDLYLDDDARFYGSATARDDIFIDDQARVHLDTSLPSIGIDDPLASDQRQVNTGSYRNGVLGSQPGAAAHTGTSVALDGSNDFIELPHHDDYRLDSGAVAFWFCTDDAGDDQGLFTKDALGFGEGGHLNIALIDGAVRARLSSDSAHYDLTSAPISRGRWYHVVFCFGPDGTALYLDGGLVGSTDYVGGLTANDEPIALGGDTSNSSAGSVSGWDDPLDGRLDDVRLYDYALDADQAAALHRGQSLGDSTLPGSIVYDTANFGAALNLRVPETAAIAWVDGGGLEVNTHTAIGSLAEARKIADAVAETDQFTLEARFRPADTLQTGPARLVTLSADHTDRNFMLGQAGPRYHYRQRTANTGSAGSTPLESDPLLDEETTQHLIISYDGESLLIYRNGALEMTEPLSGALSNWDRTQALTLGAEPDGLRPWLGTLERVAVYDRAFNQRQASNVFRGLPPGRGVATTLDVRWIEVTP